MSDGGKHLASKADFDLCNSICIAIPERYGCDVNVEQLPVTHRTVLLVWGAMGTIDNGGFEYLFERSFPGDPAFTHTAAAFNEIGCAAAVDAFREAFALFPNGHVIEDRDARIDYYQSIPEATREPLSRAFWRASAIGKGEICMRLANYIRQNEPAFTGLRSQSPTRHTR
jgi:hypothetical protein